MLPNKFFPIYYLIKIVKYGGSSSVVLERRLVVPNVAGSNPVSRPNKINIINILIYISNKLD